MMREGAYEVVQRASLTTWETGESLREVLAKDPDNTLSAEQLADAFNPAWYLRQVDEIYERFNL